MRYVPVFCLVLAAVCWSSCAYAFIGGEVRIPEEKADAVNSSQCIKLLTRPGYNGTFPELPALILANNCDNEVVIRSIHVDRARKVGDVSPDPVALKASIYDKIKLIEKNRNSFDFIYKADGEDCVFKSGSEDPLRDSCKTVSVHSGQMLEIALPPLTAYEIVGVTGGVGEAPFSIKGKMLSLYVVGFE